MKIKIDESEHHNIKMLFDEGKSVAEIARKYEVTRTSVYTILKKYGIQIKAGIPKHKDKIGKRYGHLIIKDLFQPGKSRSWQWRAICKCTNCGNEHFEVSIQNVIKGRTTSCGCRRDQYEKITGENSTQFTGHKEIRGKTWSTIKNRAAAKNREVNVTIEDAWDLFVLQDKKCALTGLPLVFGKWNTETTASLDRIDSDKGYEKDNIQWVHKDVNIMKNVFKLDYFFGICNLIAQQHPQRFRQKSKGDTNYGRFT